MKTNIFFNSIVLFVFLFSFCLEAQNKINSAGVAASYYVPVGSLSVRFLPAFSGNVFYGYKTSDAWELFSMIEYISFQEENRERLTIKRKVNIGGGEVTRVFDIPKLEMHLKIYGASANGSYRLFGNNFMKSNIIFGFGIYRWEGFRSAYFDTLRIDTLGITYDAVILQVPALKQLDWSGGFNVGMNLSAKIIDPIWFDVSASYKVIIGELWATLNLDLENVSAFQMVELKAGVRVKF